MGTTAGTETLRELRRGRPKPRMLNEPGVRVPIYPKLKPRTGKMERIQVAKSGLLEEVGGDEDQT